MKIERVSKLVEGVLEPVLDALLDAEQEQELVERLKTLRAHFQKYTNKIDNLLAELTEDNVIGEADD